MGYPLDIDIELEEKTLTIVASHKSIPPASNDLAVCPFLATLERNVHVAIDRLEVA